MEEADVTEKLTRFAAELDYPSLPREVSDFVKLCIIDQFGVQLCLSTLPVSRIAFAALFDTAGLKLMKNFPLRVIELLGRNA